MICKKCGSEISNNSYFCNCCGYDLRNEQNDNVNNFQHDEQKNLNNFNSNNTIYSNHPINKKNNSKAIIWIIGIIGFIGIFYFFVYPIIKPKYGNNKTNISDNNNNNSENINNNSNSDKISKNELIGEWNWGKQGYFVINDALISLYQDSSKDIRNSCTGTYKSIDNIQTHTAGEKENIKIIADYLSCYTNGEIYRIPTPTKEYTFEPHSDGTYTITDMVSGSTGIAYKIK